MDNHTHLFKELKVYPIKRVHRGYHGTPGDKAFLAEQCECGKVRPRDYGTTADMKLKLEGIKA